MPSKSLAESPSFQSCSRWRLAVRVRSPPMPQPGWVAPFTYRRATPCVVAVYWIVIFVQVPGSTLLLPV